MNRYDILLAIIILLSILILIPAKSNAKEKDLPKFVILLSFCPLTLCIIHYLIRGFNYISLPLYLASLTLLAVTIAKRFKIVSIILTTLTFLFTLVPSILFLVMKTQEIPVIDFSSSSYIRSFETLHNEIKEHYPLSEYKETDFDSKYKEYRKYFEKAEKDNSKEEYYTALLQYLKSYYDGHFYTVSMKQFLGLKDNLPKKILQENIGGSFGFTILELDNKKIVVSVIKEGSQAQKAGLKPVDEITKWNQKAITEAVEGTSTLWNYKYSSCANSGHIWRNKLSLLTRALLGVTAEICFIDESGTEKTITLKAENDNLELLRNDLGTFYKSNSTEENLSYKTLNNSHGYIILRNMPEDKDNTYYNKFYTALTEFKNANVEDIIIDARSNNGGYDEFGAHLLELLTKKPIYYLQEMSFSNTTDQYTPVNKAITSEPNSIDLDIPIVVLVNHQTISAGEGFVYNAKKLSNVKIAGMTGTNGSFGSIVNTYIMPENYLVFFSQIACVDESGNVMIDTDSNKNGGIKPDIQIPIDNNAVKKLYSDKVDYELEYIINYLEK